MNTDLGYAVARRLRGFSPVAPLLGNEPPEWASVALCQSVDPELFFPEQGGSARQAKQVCAACPVRAECLYEALDKERHVGQLFGIFGGLNATQRLAIIRDQWGTECPYCGDRFRDLREHSRKGACATSRRVPA